MSRIKRYSIALAYYGMIAGFGVTSLALIDGNLAVATVAAPLAVAFLGYWYTVGASISLRNAHYLHRLMRAWHQVYIAGNSIAGGRFLTMRSMLMRLEAEPLAEHLNERREGFDTSRLANAIAEASQLISRQTQGEDVDDALARLDRQEQNYRHWQRQALDRIARIQPPEACAASHKALQKALQDDAGLYEQSFTLDKPRSAAEIAGDLKRQRDQWQKALDAYEAILADLRVTQDWQRAKPTA